MNRPVKLPTMPPPGSGRFSRGRLWILTALVLALQCGFIFWLGEREPVRPRPAGRVASLRLAGPGCAQLLELMNPTLFALPHERGFSGAGWLIAPAQEIQPFAWSEPPRWLALPVEQLGATFHHFLPTSRFEPLPVPAQLEPELLLPKIADEESFPQQSTVRLADGLANRRLLNALDLPSQPSSELVSNSVVQVLVDSQGLPFSVTLIGRSGRDDADRHALGEARKARFEPLEQNTPASLRPTLSWGSLIFQWHTVPVAANKNPTAERR